MPRSEKSEANRCVKTLTRMRNRVSRSINEAPSRTNSYELAERQALAFAIQVIRGKYNLTDTTSAEREQPAFMRYWDGKGKDDSSGNAD